MLSSVILAVVTFVDEESLPKRDTMIIKWRMPILFDEAIAATHQTAPSSKSFPYGDCRKTAEDVVITVLWKKL